jgi:hypothetical protein
VSESESRNRGHCLPIDGVLAYIIVSPSNLGLPAGLRLSWAAAESTEDTVRKLMGYCRIKLCPRSNLGFRRTGSEQVVQVYEKSVCSGFPAARFGRAASASYSASKKEIDARPLSPGPGPSWSSMPPGIEVI